MCRGSTSLVHDVVWKCSALNNIFSGLMHPFLNGLPIIHFLVGLAVIHRSAVTFHMKVARVFHVEVRIFPAQCFVGPWFKPLTAQHDLLQFPGSIPGPDSLFQALRILDLCHLPS